MSERPTRRELEKRLAELEKEVRLRREVEKTLEDELEKFRGLYDLAIAMTTDRTLDQNLQLIVDQCRRLLHSDISYLSLYDESRGDFYKHTCSGIHLEAFRKIRLPPGKGLGGLVTRTQQGHIVEDYFGEAGLERLPDESIAEEGIVSGMAAPVRMGSRNLGVLYVFNRSRIRYTAADLDTLSLIGNLAAVEVARKQVESSLRESEERFRIMAQTTGDVIYRLHYDSMEYDYLSPGIRKLTGYSAEEIREIGFSRLVVRIDLPERENVSPSVIARNRAEGKTGEFRADYLIRSKEGEHKWLRDHSFPWHDDLGRVAGSVGILSDISDYRRAEALVRERTAELIKSEEKYRTLVENVPLVVYRMGLDGEVLFVNPFVEELFGYSAVEILANPRLWKETVYREDLERVLEQRRKCCSRGEELMIEYRVRHKDGRLVHVLDHAIPSFVSEGVVGSVDGIIIDVTGRRILQEKLIQAEGLRTIEEVSARLAHEIRNPLVSAGGFARRLLSSMSPEDPNRQKVQIIVKEVGRLEVILRMILTYIQPLDLDVSPIRLNALVEKVLNALEPVVTDKKIRLDLHLAPGLPKVPADPTLMERAVKTLIGNALSALSEEDVLRVSTGREENFIRMEMRYPAQNLSSDDVEHFFYPFTTFQQSYSDIDLPMAKIIVNKHGGTIEARLDPPGGIALSLSLPLEPHRPSS
ncbi:MAG TPA: PAS domain S-box protein [Syntrophobacteraceae bacterium]|nr:PAS domain S-box protein [Syntrophobacteraceae bacterium]